MTLYHMANIFMDQFLLSYEEILASNATSMRGYLAVQHVIYICSHIQNVNKQCLQMLVLNVPLISQLKHSITRSYILPDSNAKLKLIIIMCVCMCVFLACI